MTTVHGIGFQRADVERWARTLHRRMSLERAARMCGVSPGQVARWRDGAPLTDRMVRAAAIGWAADELGMVGTFGRVTTGGARMSARVLGGTIAVEVEQANGYEGSGT
jgi:hypothetical protein